MATLHSRRDITIFKFNCWFILWIYILVIRVNGHVCQMTFHTSKVCVFVHWVKYVTLNISMFYQFITASYSYTVSNHKLITYAIVLFCFSCYYIHIWSRYYTLTTETQPNSLDYSFSFALCVINTHRVIVNSIIFYWHVKLITATDFAGFMTCYFCVTHLRITDEY